MSNEKKLSLHIYEVVLSTFHLLPLRRVVVVLVQHVNGHIDSIGCYIPGLARIELDARRFRFGWQRLRDLRVGITIANRRTAVTRKP